MPAPSALTAATMATKLPAIVQPDDPIIVLGGSAATFDARMKRDMERLKAVPAVDIVGLAIRLEAVAGTLDQLPLLASAAPAGGT